jgi:hypothetical protein
MTYAGNERCGYRLKKPLNTSHTYTDIRSITGVSRIIIDAVSKELKQEDNHDKQADVL